MTLGDARPRPREASGAADAAVVQDAIAGNPEHAERPHNAGIARSAPEETAGVIKPITELTASEFLAFKECQRLLRPRLTNTLLKVFKKVTGLPLHVLWHDPLEFLNPDKPPVLCPKVRRNEGSSRSIPLVCVECLRQHWQPHPPPAGETRLVDGLCGVRFCWAATQEGAARPVTLVVQKRDPAARLDDASAMLRWILRDLYVTIEAGRTRRELEQAQYRIKMIESQNSHLHPGLQAGALDLLTGGHQARAGSHSEQIVQAMREYVHTHYQRPIQLGDIAAALKMNASYLSSLFSATMGVTFHHYLEELRLASAKKLLRNPSNRVCEVACAVGYASPGHFWRAFKAHTGLAPSTWREVQGDT